MCFLGVIGIERRNRLGKRLPQIDEDLTATVVFAFAKMILRFGKLAFENLQHVPTIIGGVTKCFGIVGPVGRVRFHAQRFAEDRTPCNIK